MAKTNKSKFLSMAKAEVTNNSLYLWGGQGESVLSLSPEKVLKMETSRANAARVLRRLSTLLASNDMKKAKYFDCSGLVIYLLMELDLIKSDYTAAGIYKSLCDPVKATSVKAGDLAFKSSNGSINHVAIIYDTNTIIEARGRDYGVVMRSLGREEWQHFGRLKCL